MGGAQQQGRAQEAGEQQGEVVIPPIRQVLSAELQAYLERIQSLLRETQALPDNEPGGPFCGWLPADKGTLFFAVLHCNLDNFNFKL